MIKKILFLVLAVFMVAASVGNCYAAGAGTLHRVSPDDDFKTYTVAGTNEAISTSTITTRHRILGFTVICDGAAGIGGIHDDTDVLSPTTTTAIAEASAISDSTETVWFPFPKKISNGITVLVGESTTTVIIYYI